jgi:hypothetical protein
VRVWPTLFSLESLERTDPVEVVPVGTGDHYEYVIGQLERRIERAKAVLESGGAVMTATGREAIAILSEGE